MGVFPTGFEPKYPAPEVFDRWVEVAARVEDRDPVAVREFYDATGRVLGWMDVHGAQSGDGVEPLVGHVIQPDLLGPPALSEAQCVALLTAVVNGELDGGRGESDYALELLSAALEQPRLTDLIYWPKRELDPATIVELARRHRGAALNPFLDSSAAVPEDAPVARRRYPPERALRESRELLVRLVEHEAIELHLGEWTAWDLALLQGPVRPEALGAWLEAHEGVSEVYASDDELKRVTATRADS